jgi:hypothetical protein
VRDQYCPFQLSLTIAEPSRKIEAGSGGYIEKSTFPF